MGFYNTNYPAFLNEAFPVKDSWRRFLLRPPEIRRTGRDRADGISLPQDRI